ncbi:MAG TPA: DUF5686 family protein [Bacteroidales bacterium]|nr:DUF5686 family protein [Bacteroidales bacterium]
MAKESSPDTSKTKSLEIKDLENTKVIIEKDAMKRDTAFWNTARPIPLTKMETSLSDSIKLPKTDTIAKADTTTKKKTNKALKKMGGYLFGGASLSMLQSHVSLKYNGLIGFDKFDFNTVDGLVYKQSLNMKVRVDSMHSIKINPGVAYAFSRESFMWWLTSDYDYAPLRGGNLKFSYNNSSTDYNQQDGAMSGQVNALASLFFRRNYKKFYGEQHFKLTNTIDIANGLKFTGSIGYREATILRNHSDYSFFYRNTREYSPNIPIGDALVQSSNVDNKEAYFGLGLEYTPEYYFRVWNGRKHYEYSKYPTFYVNYKKAISGIWGSNADFDYIEAGARQRKEWGMMHSFSWDLKGGKYLSKKNIFLSDYKFFNSQPFPVIFQDSYNTFFLPGLYDNYSKNIFAEAHAKFATPYLLLKYLPFLSNKIWLENIHLNFLYTKPMGNYWEAGYSLSQIYAVAGVGVYAGFKGSTFQSAGVRITFNFK